MSSRNNAITASDLTYKTEDIIKSLKENRQKYVEAYAQLEVALAAKNKVRKAEHIEKLRKYPTEVSEMIEKSVAELSEGKSGSINYNHPACPGDWDEEHPRPNIVESYDVALTALENCQEESVMLDSDQVARYLRDEWPGQKWFWRQLKDCEKYLPAAAEEPAPESPQDPES